MIERNTVFSQLIGTITKQERNMTLLLRVHYTISSHLAQIQVGHFLIYMY